MPVLGTFITVFGSTEGSGYVEQARKLNAVVCGPHDEGTRLPYLGAAIRAWWVAEYSGWYLEDAPGSVLPNVNVDDGKKRPFAKTVSNFAKTVQRIARDQEYSSKLSGMELSTFV